MACVCTLRPCFLCCNDVWTLVKACLTCLSKFTAGIFKSAPYLLLQLGYSTNVRYQHCIKHSGPPSYFSLFPQPVLPSLSTPAHFLSPFFLLLCATLSLSWNALHNVHHLIALFLRTMQKKKKAFFKFRVSLSLARLHSVYSVLPEWADENVCD